jgi:hypothetical protein
MFSFSVSLRSKLPIPAKLKGLKTEITANPFQKLSWTTTDFILKNIIGAAR